MPWLAVGVLNIRDVMFAHNVPVARERRVLKVTLQVAAAGAASAVCVCLVAVRSHGMHAVHGCDGPLLHM